MEAVVPFKRKRSTVVDVSDDQNFALVRYDDDGTFGVVKRDENGDPVEVSSHKTSTEALAAFDAAVAKRRLAVN